MALRTDSTNLNLVTGQSFKYSPGPKRGVSSFVRNNITIIVALTLGTGAATGCFGFTFWLSKQNFHCEVWALHCHRPSAVKAFVSNLGLVQGIVSTIYDLSIASITYAAYQLAETTLWPAMTQQSFTFPQIDRFLTHVRGDMPSWPYELYHARTVKFFFVILIVGLLGLLAWIDATIVGWAFTVVDVATPVFSNHTIGAGIGFGFRQQNPPGPMPAAAGAAANLYAAWSFGRASEPLPELREYILDRINLSSIGEFSVRAVEARRKINCSGMPIEIAGLVPDQENVQNPYYKVVTSQLGNTELRLQNSLTTWVDRYDKKSNSRAVTRLMFAIIGGKIEGGHTYTFNDEQSFFFDTYPYTYGSSIDSLACDVDIDLVDSLACTGKCTEIDATLSSIETLHTEYYTAFGPPPRNVSEIPIYMAAACTQFGAAIYGRQPLFDPGTPVHNSPYALPVANSDWSLPLETPQYWTQADLTNFIDVAAGAFGIMLPTAWQVNVSPNVTVESVLQMPRLDTRRSYVLLAPPLIALLFVGVMTLLSVLMHHESSVTDVKLGDIGEIVLNTQTAEVKSLTEDIRTGVRKRSALEHVRLRYGKVADGFDGLGLSPSANGDAQTRLLQKEH